MKKIRLFLKQLFCRHKSLHIKSRHPFYVKDAYGLYEGEVTIVDGICLNCGKSITRSKDRIHYPKRFTKEELNEYLQNLK